jgi:hypothetical protein
MNKKSSSIGSITNLQETDDNVIFNSTTRIIISNNNDDFDAKSSKLLINEPETKTVKKMQQITKHPSLHECNLTLTSTRVLFMVFIITLLILSFFLFIPISQLYINFNNQCPLYSNIYIRFSLSFNQANFFSSMPLKVDNHTNITTTTTTTTTIISVAAQNTTKPKVYIEIDQLKTKWTMMLACEYCLSIGVLILCYCVISLFFFIMFNMHDIIDNDDCLIVPWLILTVILTLCLFVSNCLVTNGFSIFCFNLLNNNYVQTSYYLQGKCWYAQLFEWRKVSNGAYFYNYYLVLIFCSWLAFFNLLIIDFLLVLRIKLNIKIKRYNLIVKVAGVFSSLHDRFDNNGSNKRRGGSSGKLVKSFGIDETQL